MIGYFNTYFQKYWQSKKQKTYTSLGLSLILILIFGIFALRPTLLTVIELREKLSQGQKANTRLDEKIQSLSQAQVNYEKVKTELPLIEAALPKDPKILDFLNKVDFLAKKNELLIDKVQAQGISLQSQTKAANETAQDNQDTAHNPREITFSFNAKGYYPNLRSFLNELQALERAVNLDEIGIEKPKDEDNLNLSLKGMVYYLEE